MAEHIKNLRHPITAVIDGNEIKLVTIGHLATAIHRTSWSARYWARLGLLPGPPFVINVDTSNIRRYLYPDEFVTAITDVVAHYPGRRLDRIHWRTLQMEANEAYLRIVLPLLPDGVMTPMPISVAETLRSQEIHTLVGER